MTYSLYIMSYLTTRNQIIPTVSEDGGYASLSVLILVMALSILIAAGLSLSQQVHHQAQAAYNSAQTDEALNKAMMRFGVESLQSQERESVKATYTLNNQTVYVTGENEALKWPVKDAVKLTPALLSDRVQKVSFDDMLDLIKSVNPTSIGPRDMPRNDCFRRLFSPYGQAEFKPRPPALALNPSGLTSKEGQVWRFRAIIGNRVRESWVRFTGGADRLYAVISEQDLTLSQEPPCVF